jgi:hypothetical protein
MIDIDAAYLMVFSTLAVVFDKVAERNNIMVITYKFNNGCPGGGWLYSCCIYSQLMLSVVSGIQVKALVD